jgi:hypothetical protein
MDELMFNRDVLVSMMVFLAFIRTFFTGRDAMMIGKTVRSLRVSDLTPGMFVCSAFHFINYFYSNVATKAGVGSTLAGAVSAFSKTDNKLIR